MMLDDLIYPQDGWGYLPSTENVYSAFNYVKENFKCSSILEIGFYLGHSTTYMLNIFDKSKITSISPPDFYAGEDACRKFEQADKLKKRWGSRWQWFSGYTEQCYDLIKHKNFDFCFLDGSHHYEFVKYDLKTCYNLNINNILVDNYELLSVKLTVDSSPEYQVTKIFDYHVNHKKVNHDCQIALLEKC